MSAERRFLLVLLCFFLSGFAALLYETAWTREFAFVFGTSDLAVVSVLAAYMAGLAAGAAVAARLATRVRRPVLVYGLLELGIAVSALAVPMAIRGATSVYVLAFGSQSAPPDEGQLAGAIFYLACSFAILAVPTALMGATLPLLTRYAVRREEEIGRRIGVLYAINTAGAVAGTLGAAFVLLPAVGLRQTVYAGVATNAAVFAAAALLARRVEPVAPAAPRLAGPLGAANARWILPLIALSGVASFTYEVLWTRLLTHLLGGSVTAFATMLASFLLGIAAGSAIAARRATDPRRAVRGFAVVQLAIAALSAAAFAAVDALPDFARAIGAGGHGPHFANALVAISVLLPAALCIGATFPFAVRALARDESHAAPASARVYAWNTVGAIVGSVAAGFALLPWLGFAGTLVAAVGVNLALALAAALLARPTLRPLAAIAAAAIAILAVAQPPTPWNLLRVTPSSGESLKGDIEYFAVGRSATVLLLREAGGWRLNTNGLSEARIRYPGQRPERFVSARWLGLLPVLAHPEARSLLLVGLGGCTALEAMPRTLETIDVIELEREVLRANEALVAERGVDPLADPRVRVHLNDARGALMLTEARYDAIVSQPSHPWTAGASHLYTSEFFALVREHLNPAGVFVQWIGLAFVDEPLLRSLVASLLETFPFVQLFQPLPKSVLFLASDAPLAVHARAQRALAAAPSDFARFDLRTPEDVVAALVVDEKDARRFAATAPINTDDHNRLATGSARLGNRDVKPASAARLFAPFDPLPELAEKVDRDYLVRRLARYGKFRRAARIARAIRNPAARETAMGWIEHAGGRASPARRRFERALKLDPGSSDARAGLLVVNKRNLEKGDPAALALAEGLEGPAAAVAAGWQHAARKDWEALRALEPQLAAAPPRDPLFAETTRLRASWRVASGRPALANEALELVGGSLSARARLEDFVLHARAASAAGRPVVAFFDLAHVAEAAEKPRGSSAAAVARDALDVFDELRPYHPSPGAARVRERLERAAR